jgi:hypothetical protein
VVDGIIKKKCSCGQSKTYKFSEVSTEKIMCIQCHNYIFRDKLAEFKYKTRCAIAKQKVIDFRNSH